MGSDNHKTTPRGWRRLRRKCSQHWKNPMKRKRALLSVTTASVALLVTKRLLPPPELLLFDTFAPTDEALLSLPAQCRSTASRAYRCQREAPLTLVLGCHRRWCNSVGYCDACAGIGDRFFNFGMNHIQHALSGAGDYPLVWKERVTSERGNGGWSGENRPDCLLRVELDYPANGLTILEDAIYRDASGWMGELFRFRSHEPIGSSLPPEFLSDHSTDTLVAHLMTGQMQWQDGRTDLPVSLRTTWDPCLFHAYFRPNAQMERTLDYHQHQLSDTSELDGVNEGDISIIGIHFRTGDALSFQDLAIPEDVRIGQGTSVQASWDRMKQCTLELAQSAPEYRNKKHIRYVLASDSLEVKRLAREESDMDIYTTDVRPSNFRQNPRRDTDAWMELFLLSRQDGLVMNALADNAAYSGKAGNISAFAKLVERIGFFRSDQVKICEV